MLRGASIFRVHNVEMAWRVVLSVHRSQRNVKQTALAMRLILGGVFLYSGLVKASSSAQFAIALAPFTFLPTTWFRPVAVLLPLCEMVAGVLVLTPRTIARRGRPDFRIMRRLRNSVGLGARQWHHCELLVLWPRRDPLRSQDGHRHGTRPLLGRPGADRAVLERKLSNGSRVRQSLETPLPSPRNTPDIFQRIPRSGSDCETRNAQRLVFRFRPADMEYR